MNKKLNFELKKFYAWNFFGNALTMFPIIVLFWQNIGLSMTQIGLLQSIYTACIAIFEIPTGYLADIIGRKKTLIFASFTLLFASFIYSFATNFRQCAISEILYALAMSLNSGTNDSYLYETLKNYGKENEFKKISGNSRMRAMRGTAIGNFLGGIIAQLLKNTQIHTPIMTFSNLRFVFFLSVIPLTIHFFISLTFKEPKREIAQITHKNFLQDLKKSLIKEVFQKKYLIKTIFFLLFIRGLNRIRIFFQPYLKALSIPLSALGIILGIMELIGGSLSKFTYKIEKKLGFNKTLRLRIFIMVISDIGLGINKSWQIAIIFITATHFTRGMFKILIKDLIHKEISDKYRATISSIQSLALRIMYSMILPIRGYFSDLRTLQTTFIIIGITILFSSISLYFLLKLPQYQKN